MNYGANHEKNDCDKPDQEIKAPGLQKSLSNIRKIDQSRPHSFFAVLHDKPNLHIIKKHSDY